MVSILAKQVVDFDFTLNLTNNQSFNSFFSNVTFPVFDVSTELGGFTYTESINIVSDIDPISIDGGPSNLRLNHSPLIADFNGVNLLPGQLTENIVSGSGGAQNLDLSGNNLLTVDKYLDTPLNFEISIFTTDNNGNNSADGDQTINGNLSIIVIGRQP